MSNHQDHTITLPVTIRNETRDVTMTYRTWDDSPHAMCLKSDAGGAFSKGGKVWFRGLDFYQHRKTGQWMVRTNEVFLNRNGYRLIDWEDNARGKHDSEHNSA